MAWFPTFSKFTVTSLRLNADWSKEIALIEFARTANKEPLSVSDDDFLSVRETGATDAEIVEALGVMGASPPLINSLTLYGLILTSDA